MCIEKKRKRKKTISLSIISEYFDKKNIYYISRDFFSMLVRIRSELHIQHLSSRLD